MRITLILHLVLLAPLCLSLPACQQQEAHAELESHHTIVVTSPIAKDVILTQQYVCQIHSRRHINVCALESGYLEEIGVNEGQVVKQGDLMFKILPTLYQAKLDAELAEAKLAQLELNNTSRLLKDHVVSPNEVALFEAKLARAKAKAQLAQAELNFCLVKAPFDGIVDRLHEQLGSLIDEGDTLTTLSDNSVMWVYFNVPEARYLEYMADHANEHLPGQGNNAAGNNADPKADGQRAQESTESPEIELVLANGNTFNHNGKIGAIEAKFNNETGNIPFRADFPNPDRLLRHGQTGNILIHRTLKGAIVIPQRATFEILDKRYVYVIDDDGTVHQRYITIQHEKDDIFVIKSGLAVSDKIVLEGVREVHDGDKVEFEFVKPEEALANQKNHAE